VVDPALLQRVFAELAAERQIQNFQHNDQRLEPHQATLVIDGTCGERSLYGVGAMALSTRQGGALKLHLKLTCWKRSQWSALANARLRASCLAQVVAGDFHVGDRYYGEDYALFSELESAGCSFTVGTLFKWLKCILGCRHWLAESQRGVAASLLRLDRRAACCAITDAAPGKRAMEMIRFYLLGYATLDELSAALKRYKFGLSAQRLFKIMQRQGEALSITPNPTPNNCTVRNLLSTIAPTPQLHCQRDRFEHSCQRRIFVAGLFYPFRLAGMGILNLQRGSGPVISAKIRKRSCLVRKSDRCQYDRRLLRDIRASAPPLFCLLWRGKTAPDIQCSLPVQKEKYRPRSENNKSASGNHSNPT
jgi:hypothetical protein